MTVPITGRLEVQFVPGGSWVDLSTLVQSVQILRPRPTLDQPAVITTLTAVILNAPDPVTGFSPLTPDSPLTPYYPNIDRDRMVRFTAVWAGGASTSVRFFGWSDTWSPDTADGSPGSATVTLTASCVLSRYARRSLLSDYGEYIVQSGNEYWPYDDSADSTMLRGLATGYTVAPAQVVPAALGGGSMTLGSVDGTILVDGAATFSRGDGTSSSPVIVHTIRGGQLARVSAWVRLDQDPAGVDDDVIVAYTPAGVLKWRLVAAIVSGKVEWRIVDVNGVIRTPWNSGVPRDDTWHWFSVYLYDNAGDPGSALAVRDKTIPDRLVSGYFTPWPSDPSLNVGYLVVGGQMNPLRPGKQGNTLMGSVSSLWVQYAALGYGGQSSLGAAGYPYTGVGRTGMLVQYGLTVDGLVGGGVGGGDADGTPVQLTGANRNLLDAWAEHARTTGGRVLTRPDGRRQWVSPTKVRAGAVALTLDASEDLHMPAGGWQGERVERPTRVTVTSPSGSVTQIDTVTETLTGVRLDGPDVATSAGNQRVARSVAGAVLAAGATRLASFGVDATLTATDKTAALMALIPGDRVRVGGLPASNLGVTFMDIFASGWSETFIGDGNQAQFVFDTDPADAPPVAVFDDAEFGRMGMSGSPTITGGTCVGNTGTGTVVITTTSPLTTTAGQYPMDLDWFGERITVSGVGGGTSPQTATVTARGVAPSVARVHATGQAVQLWHVATFGP